MKKILCLIIIAALCVLLVGCGKANNETTNNNNETNNEQRDITGRLVSNKFSIKFPEGWELENNDGDPQANEPGTDAFIQLTTMAMSAKAYCKSMRAGDPVAVTIGEYTFQKCSSAFGTLIHVYELNASTVALITSYQVNDETMNNVLASFKID